MPQCAHVPEGAVVELTALPRTVPPRVSEHGPRLLRESRAWARAALQPFVEANIEPFLADESPLWMSHCFPDADPVAVRPFYDLYQIMFLLDDLSAVPDARPDGRTLAALAAVLSDTRRPATGLEHLASEAFLATLSGDPPGLAARTRAGMATMLNGFTEQSALWDRASTARPLTLARAMPVRERAIGIAWYMTNPEHVHSCDMTGMREQWPLLRELATALAHQTWFVNDVCSFRKEHFHGEHQNLVCVCLTSGATLQEAFSLVSGWAAQMQRDYASLAALARDDPRGARPPVATYLDALDTMLAGANAWQYSTPRYHGPGFHCPPTERSRWALFADRTELLDPGQAPP
ncbi:hypothetical protein ABTX81_01345 [Kitasatospora sp. NPDC097605]|uniref:terpene synthase family protein n=1 Tax=Kitasatospora sp. NPDC097605 TaxID=3157226 RepID=UPI003326B870